jgi:hypothetical protein
MPKETRKSMLKEAQKLAKDVYSVDAVRSMEKVYTIVERPTDEVSMVLNGIVPDMADVPEAPTVLENTLQLMRGKQLFDPEYLWTGSCFRVMAPEEGILTGKVIMDHLTKVKRFLGRNPEKAIVFVNDDGYYLVKERPTTLREVRMLRDHLRSIDEENELELAKAKASRGRQKLLEHLIDAADKVGIEDAIKTLQEGPTCKSGKRKGSK